MSWYKTNPKTIIKTSEGLQKDVEDAIKGEPLLNAAEVGVTANDGVVTGTVDSYPRKPESEDAAKNVAGVKAVNEKFVVESGHMGIKSDDEVASEVVAAFNHTWETLDQAKEKSGQHATRGCPNPILRR